MSMKIDGHHHSAGTGRTHRGEAPTAPGRGSQTGSQRATTGADWVETSPDLRLASAATKAILESPDVRPEAVERGRLAVENGTAGADADRLADAIITSMLGQ